jgi:hypothetical protein
MIPIPIDIVPTSPLGGKHRISPFSPEHSLNPPNPQPPTPFKTATHGAGDPRPGLNNSGSSLPRGRDGDSTRSVANPRSRTVTEIVHGPLPFAFQNADHYRFHFPKGMVVDLQETLRSVSTFYISLLIGSFP